MNKTTVPLKYKVCFAIILYHTRNQHANNFMFFVVFTSCFTKNDINLLKLTKHSDCVTIVSIKVL